MHPSEHPQDDRYQSRDDNKPQFRTAYLLALYLLPLLTTSLALWAVLHTWHLQLSPNILHHNQPVPTQATYPHRWTTCGTTPSTARARNCRFDILSFAWQTPECYDAELMTAFLQHRPWQFYAHPNRTDAVVSLEVALQGEQTLYVDWAYHVAHCTFMWRQMHRAYRLRGWVDSHLDAYKHTLHCQGVLLERGVGGGRVNVVAAVKYPECREVGGRG
ncbi:hypothetical protein F5144DRAFT_595548 [Chaetomium tenue]|uniref:Uncharacterized protein n=1 Tax=Chaetomium tenue TaxID=1854479 RepID=A0ACB7NYV0_9PEZI|nr:hypothetical protein F5144DRAFT_595548 [Chaetomium globosum]